MNAVCWGGRLLLIHVFFIIIVWLATYFSGLDVAITLVYLYLIWKASHLIGRGCPEAPYRSLVFTGLIAQSPGLLLTVANLLYYFGSGPVPADFTFLLELWHTPLMPILSFFSFPVFQGYIFYFVALFFLPPVYLVTLVVGYVCQNSLNNKKGFKYYGKKC